jgi:hypothetical protein
MSVKWGQPLSEWLRKKNPQAKLEGHDLKDFYNIVVQQLSADGMAMDDSSKVGDAMLGVLLAHPAFLLRLVEAE